jgi:hypothetical protein
MRHMREATLGWGPNADGDSGHMNDRNITSFVLFNGVPPDMAARRGGQPSLERLKEMVALQTPWRPDPPLDRGATQQLSYKERKCPGMTRPTATPAARKSPERTTAKSMVAIDCS